MSAAPLHHRVSKMSRDYLALRVRQDQERSAFIFNPELQRQIIYLRNDLIELQAKLRKEVNAS